MIRELAGTHTEANMPRKLYKQTLQSFPGSYNGRSLQVKEHHSCNGEAVQAKCESQHLCVQDITYLSGGKEYSLSVAFYGFRRNTVSKS